MNYGSSTSGSKRWIWVSLDLIFTMRDIYINSNLNPITKFTSSSRSIEFKDIFPWNISLMTTKTIPISTRILINYAMKRCIPFWGMETETTTRSKIPNGVKAIAEQIEERKKSKRAGQWESQSGRRVGILFWAGEYNISFYLWLHTQKSSVWMKIFDEKLQNSRIRSSMV